MASSIKDLNKVAEAIAHIAQLRTEVEALMKDRVTPAFVETAGRIGSAAYGVAGVSRNQTKMVSGKVRSRPLAAILIAAAIGFVLGRASP
jgi:ElaB/YqjD/DUF883 family membrane-anchored ribosome-binding protein